MRLVSFAAAGRLRAGLLVADRVVDVARARPGLAPTVSRLLAAWDDAAPVLLELAGSAVARDGHHRLADVRLVAPLAPVRVLGTGANYVSHQREMDVAAPPQPSCFLKLPGTVAGPDDELRLGSEQRCVDYEGEIAVVLGRPARDIDPADATDVIAGLMLANDISARDVPMAHLALGKGSPGFCPLGPQLVTLDEIALDDVSFTVTVNGELRQQAHTSEMSHTFGEIVASFSHALPLDAGDVILTGTPAGVGVGMVPPRFLDDGDTVVIASPQLGTLRTTVSRPARAASPVSP